MASAGYVVKVQVGSSGRRGALVACRRGRRSASSSSVSPWLSTSHSLFTLVPCERADSSHECTAATDVRPTHLHPAKSPTAVANSPRARPSSTLQLARLQGPPHGARAPHNLLDSASARATAPLARRTGPQTFPLPLPPLLQPFSFRSPRPPSSLAVEAGGSPPLLHGRVRAVPSGARGHSGGSERLLRAFRSSTIDTPARSLAGPDALAPTGSGDEQWVYALRCATLGSLRRAQARPSGGGRGRRGRRDILSRARSSACVAVRSFAPSLL